MGLIKPQKFRTLNPDGTPIFERRPGRRNFASGLLAAAGGAVLGAGCEPAGAQPQTTGSVSLGVASGNALPGNYGGIDDPTNVSGLGAPAIIRGTVYGHLAAGVTMGSGNTQTVQTATAVGLQNAINYASSANKFFELVPGDYEIYSSTGLVIPNTGGSFFWRGQEGATVITQFYHSGSGAPIITIGDISGNSLSYGMDIDGMFLRYGASQSGLTASNACIICPSFGGKFKGIDVSISLGFIPYNGIAIYSLGGPYAGSFYSNSCADWQISGAVANLLAIYDGGTGNVFDNIYLNNDGAALTGSYLLMDAGQIPEWTFRQLNCELGSCNTVISLNQNVGIRFEAVHVEQVVMTGTNPTIFLTQGECNVDIDTLDLIDIQWLTTNMTGNPTIFSDYTPAPGLIRCRNLNMVTYLTSQITSTVVAFNSSSSPTDNIDSCIIDGIYIDDATATGQYTGHFLLDYNAAPQSAYPTPSSIVHYRWNQWASVVDGAVIPISATFTLYGQYINTTIQVPATISGFTLTLSNVMAATGSQPTATGTVTHIRRLSGTGSGTLLVKDDAGSTLTTSTTAAQDYYYIFNGLHYVAFTALTPV